MKQSLLVKIGYEKFRKEKVMVPFTGIFEEDSFLNDIIKYPHAFVLGCIMDRQLKSEKAWHIPYAIYKELKTFDINKLGKVTEKEFKDIFNKKRLHRYNDDEASFFYKAVQRIINLYDGDASKIWINKPSSARVVYNILQFDGCGIKIATMAANILARDFRIKFSDYYSIDISPDLHIDRVMKRLGLVEKNASREEIIFKAREINPIYPGVIDSACWEIGREYCHSKKPDCSNCPMRKECKKVI